MSANLLVLRSGVVSRKIDLCRHPPGRAAGATQTSVRFRVVRLDRIAAFSDARSLTNGRQELTAGFLASPAGLLAHAAVRVVRGVPLALISTALADDYARLDQRLVQIGIPLR